MKIKYGLNNHAVIQRFGENSCRCQIIGESNSKSPIAITVTTLDATEVESAKLESPVFQPLEDDWFRFECQLSGIPSGGPYTIVLKQDTTIVFSDVCVGDLYVLAGQSNMEGIGKLKDRLPSHLMTRAFYMDDHWREALDPINDLTTAIDDVHKHINGGPFEPKNQKTGTGLGVSFGQNLCRLTGVPIGVIACAHGGTTMDQWSPNYAHNDGYGLYHMMLHRIKKSGGFISGLVWYQGCSDTYPIESRTYFDKMTHFISSIRNAIDAQLPIVLMQIARCCSHENDATFWNTVQQHQYHLGEHLSNLQVVSTIDLEMDDFIHISGKSHQRLGKRCADAMHYLQYGADLPTPRLGTIALERDEDSWNHNIRLTYDFIDDHLISTGTPNGFVLTDAKSGDVKHFIYHTELMDNQILLKTTESSLDLANCELNYGQGFMPYCNITDGADRALPVLYRLKLGEKRQLSLPCTRAWISLDKTFPEIQESQSILTALQIYEYRDFWFYFLNSHLIATDAIMYHIPFEIASTEEDTVDINLLIGGFGRFEIFIDAALTHQMTLSNMIAPDQYTVPLKVTRGKHLLSIWYLPSDFPIGIFVRFDLKQTTTDLIWL